MNLEQYLLKINISTEEYKDLNDLILLYSLKEETKHILDFINDFDSSVKENKMFDSLVYGNTRTGKTILVNSLAVNLIKKYRLHVYRKDFISFYNECSRENLFPSKYAQVDLLIIDDFNYINHVTEYFLLRFLSLLKWRRTYKKFTCIISRGNLDYIKNINIDLYNFFMDRYNIIKTLNIVKDFQKKDGKIYE